MDKFCEDCIHNEVCRYEAYCPSGHCNDKETIDDLRPQGEWIIVDHLSSGELKIRCNNYKADFRRRFLPKFCEFCGAKMVDGAK